MLHGFSHRWQRPLGPNHALQEATAASLHELLEVMRADCARVTSLVASLNDLPIVTELLPSASIAPTAILSTALVAALSQQAGITKADHKRH